MGVAQPSASPTDLKVGTKTYRVGPLKYKDRGILEHRYFAVAKSPAEFIESALAKVNSDEVRQHYSVALKNAQIMSVNWEPHIEDDQAKVLFTSNGGRPDGDEFDYPSYFLFVCLSPFSTNNVNSPEEAQAIRDEMTKSQIQWLWNFCLEVGPFRPKSSEDDE